MRARTFKWLLIGLMVVSFAGRPWAQTSPASTQGCGGTSIAAAHDAGELASSDRIAASETAAQHDSGKTKSAECAKTCAALQVMALAAMTWSPGVWPQSHDAAIEVALIGHPPKPELFPPIAML